LEIEVNGIAEPWRQVADFLASGRDDPHFVLNANAGEIRLGDGERGRIPAAGADIVARTYRYGGGTAGNVGEGLISTQVTNLPGVEKVTNERRAVGGRDEQDVKELKEQAPHELRSRGRAVTAEDYTALAEQAGGVAKATALPLMHPDHPGVEVPGAVTVVIVPDSDDEAPQPSPDQIQEVCRYLNRFRLLTAELYVKGPAYQAISVEAQVSAQPYAAFDAVAEAVKSAINDYLAPLPRKGTERAGWSFGKDLHPTNLYGVILRVKEVAAVVKLTLLVDGRPRDDIKTRVRVPPDGLLYGANHTITVVPVTDL
jgi:predicted phage baseplate assembly protein